MPITVDVEDGWGRDPADLAAQLWEMGVAGLNVEDSCDGRLVDPDAHGAVVAAMKAAAPRLFVNARVDTWWLGDDRSSTLARARRYADAGADGVFVPAADEATVEEVVAVVGVPVNVLADRPVARWRELGVRRVSTGSLPYRAALRAAADVAAAVAAGARPPQALALDEVNGLFA